MHQKLAPDSFLILINNPKQLLHAKKSLKNLKKDYQKALKKLTLFFLFNPVSFNEQSYQKQKGSGTNHQSLFRSQNKLEKFLYLLYII